MSGGFSFRSVLCARGRGRGRRKNSTNRSCGCPGPGAPQAPRIRWPGGPEIQHDLEPSRPLDRDVGQAGPYPEEPALLRLTDVTEHSQLLIRLAAFAIRRVCMNMNGTGSMRRTSTCAGRGPGASGRSARGKGGRKHERPSRPAPAIPPGGWRPKRAPPRSYAARASVSG